MNHQQNAIIALSTLHNLSVVQRNDDNINMENVHITSIANLDRAYTEMALAAKELEQRVSQLRKKNETSPFEIGMPSTLNYVPSLTINQFRSYHYNTHEQILR